VFKNIVVLDGDMGILPMRGILMSERCTHGQDARVTTERVCSYTMSAAIAVAITWTTVALVRGVER
jgi:hypothetical protein